MTVNWEPGHVVEPVVLLALCDSEHGNSYVKAAEQNYLIPYELSRNHYES
jgi:hypothetical protein